LAEDYKVKSGECASSIAQNHGLFWETVWNHPKNAELKKKRGDPNILKEGDVLHIPDFAVKEETAATEQRHKFVRKGVPAKLRLRIVEEPTDEEESSEESSSGSSKGSPMDSVAAMGKKFLPSQGPADPPPEDSEKVKEKKDKPRANVPYVLDIDGILTNGNTDADGVMECVIPPNAKSGKLIVEPGTVKEMTIPLKLGHLDPLEELSGVKQRLANLGFDCGETSEKPTPELKAALVAFQEKHALSVTGDADKETKDKLGELHGG